MKVAVAVLLMAMCSAVNASNLRTAGTGPAAAGGALKAHSLSHTAKLSVEQKASLKNVEAMLEPPPKTYEEAKAGSAVMKTVDLVTKYTTAKKAADQVTSLAQAIQNAVDELDKNGKMKTLKTDTDKNKQKMADLKASKDKEHQDWATEVADLTDDQAKDIAQMDEEQTKVIVKFNDLLVNAQKLPEEGKELKAELEGAIQAVEGLIAKGKPNIAPWTKAFQDILARAKGYTPTQPTCPPVIGQLETEVASLGEADAAIKKHEAEAAEEKKKVAAAYKAFEDKMKEMGTQIKAANTEVENVKSVIVAQEKKFSDAVSAIVAKMKGPAVAVSAAPAGGKGTGDAKPKSLIEISAGASTAETLGRLLKRALADPEGPNGADLQKIKQGLLMSDSLYDENFDDGNKFDLAKFKADGFKSKLEEAPAKYKAALDAAVKAMDVKMKVVRDAVACVSKWITYKKGLMVQEVYLPDLEKEKAAVKTAHYEAHKAIHQAWEAWRQKIDAVGKTVVEAEDLLIQGDGSWWDLADEYKITVMTTLQTIQDIINAADAKILKFSDENIDMFCKPPAAKPEPPKKSKKPPKLGAADTQDMAKKIAENTAKAEAAKEGLQTAAERVGSIAGSSTETQ